MNYTRITAPLLALGVGLAISACSGAATTSNSSVSSTANKTTTSASPTTSPASPASLAKQGTPPKADMTMTMEALHKDYKTMYDKDPKSVGDKYENKNIEVSGTVSRTYPVTTGTGVMQIVSFKGPTSNDDEGSCRFDTQTEESQAIKVGDTVTMIGTQTHNSNGSIPALEKCFVIKDSQ